MIDLTAKVVERGSVEITAGPFLDFNGLEIVPTSLTYTLTNSVGTVVDGLELVTLTPALTVSWVIYGDSLAILSSTDNGWRVVVIEGTYTDADYGAGIPIKEAARFRIENLPRTAADYDPTP
jgi:hypothetical protein